ncbi:5397_t:CDS:2 [Entrophospora sp. SA101]|nr:5397_t:CDS:2 [Entrophospora sp. SA101]
MEPFSQTDIHIAQRYSCHSKVELSTDVWKEGLVNGYDTEKHPSKFIIVNSKACLMKQTRSLLIKLSLDD